MRQRTSPIAHLTLLAATATAVLTAPALAQEGGVATERKGRIIDAPGNIRAFSPDESFRSIDAINVDLRAYFEDLGPDAILWMQHVQTLSNPFFEGRSAGTRGFELTLEYVEFYMRRYGLEPAFPTEEGGRDWVTYVQPFTYRGFPRRSFTLKDPRLEMGGAVLSKDVDYAILAPSGGEAVTAPLTFVGYAITDEERGYYSFEEDTDLTGRIAIMLRYEPLDDEGRSRWDDTRFSPQARLSPKVRSVVERGAAGIIMVNPPDAIDGKNGLETLETSAGFGRSREIPFLQINRDVADRMLRAADPGGRGLLEWRQSADRGAVGTVDLSDDYRVTMSGNVQVDMERADAPSSNVGGVLRGRGRLADEWIVIGGHCDHVGYGQAGGAMPGSRGEVHPGADDNASGTAGVLLLSKWLSSYYAAADGQDLRSILFLAFGAEEVGLRGSAYYLDHPTIDPERITFMLNMDMIGRLRNDTIMMGGTGTASEYEDILPPLIEESGLTAAFSPLGSGPSDHANFNSAGIPVIFMFTGLHEEYHRPGDQGYTVNPEGAVRVAELSEAIVREVASRRNPLTYQETGRRRTARGERARDGAPRGGDDAGGRTVEAATIEPAPATPPAGGRAGGNVQFGIVPDYTAELDRGILVGEITAGTAADEAGIRGGDVLVGWDDQDLEGLRQFAELLGQHAPGDTVKITLERGGKTITLPVTLKEREG